GMEQWARMCGCPPKSGRLLPVAQWPSARVKDSNPDAHVFCTSTKDSANFDLVYDRNQPAPVVDSLGDPIMSLGNVADMDAAMPECDSILMAAMGEFANKFDRVARSDLLVDEAAAIDPLGGFTSEFCYPGRVRLHTVFGKQGQSICPSLPLSGLRRHGPRSQEDRMDRW